MNIWNEKEVHCGVDQLIEISLDIHDECKWMEENLTKNINYKSDMLFRCVATKLCNDLYDLCIAVDKGRTNINSFDYSIKKLKEHFKTYQMKNEYERIEQVQNYLVSKKIPKSESPLLGKRMNNDLLIEQIEWTAMKNWISGLKHNYIYQKSPLFNIGKNHIVTMLELRLVCDFVRSIAQIIYRIVKPDSDIHMARE